LLASACASAPIDTASRPPSPPTVSVFAVAHQDDWQLFMNPEAYHAMNEPQEKAVFIHVTAGDAGAGAGGPGPVPYYLAREEGALRAVRFMANAADPTTGRGAAMYSAMVERGGHVVQRHAYANAVVYFLRLPDGNIVNGTVFTPHPESITRLRSGEAATSGTVENSARYEGWDDLLGTLNAIVESERVAGSGLTLHIAELDEEMNPGDHPDHRATALAMEAVAAKYPCAPLYRHIEYFTRTKPVNLSGEDYMIDVGTWAATASGLSDNHAKATWEKDHNAWIGRSYSRVQTPAVGCAQ
jgi:hypothetical protein